MIVSSLHWVYRYLYPHTQRQIIWVPHIETHHLMAQVRNSSDCFFIVVCLQVSTSTHWDAKKKSNTYCHTSLHGLIAQHFWLFFHCILLTGMDIHTLRCKDEDHHILSDSVWWVQCGTGTDVSGLSCVHRYMRPHSHRQTKTPSHIDTCRLMQLMLNNSICLFFYLC